MLILLGQAGAIAWGYSAGVSPIFHMGLLLVITLLIGGVANRMPQVSASPELGRNRTPLTNLGS